MTTGSITCLSGQHGSRPVVGAVVTSAMHAAVEVLAQCLALELAPIRVNAVAPGLIDTPLLGDFREQGAEWASATLPAGRIGTAEEVAQAVMLLMTNDFITGKFSTSTVVADTSDSCTSRAGATRSRGTLAAERVAHTFGASFTRSLRRFSCAPKCGRRRSEVPRTVHPALRRGNAAPARSDVYR